MPGTISEVKVKQGDEVKQGDALIITEAMKMETTIQAPFDGTVSNIYVSAGDSIQTQDLIITIDKA